MKFINIHSYCNDMFTMCNCYMCMYTATTVITLGKVEVQTSLHRQHKSTTCTNYGSQKDKDVGSNTWDI